jgi:hypothetical protein
MKIEMFKAKKQTGRFNENQDVWVIFNYANHLDIRFKYRGKGRYVNGVIDKWNTNGTKLNEVIGEIKSIDISEAFYKRLINDRDKQNIYQQPNP